MFSSFSGTSGEEEPRPFHRAATNPPESPQSGEWASESPGERRSVWRSPTPPCAALRRSLRVATTPTPRREAPLGEGKRNAAASAQAAPGEGARHDREAPQGPGAAPARPRCAAPGPAPPPFPGTPFPSPAYPAPAAQRNRGRPRRRKGAGPGAGRARRNRVREPELYGTVPHLFAAQGKAPTLNKTQRSYVHYRIYYKLYHASINKIYKANRNISI